MTTSNRNYQLQGSYTRYHDGLRIGYDTPRENKQRNFATMESAMRAAKKELKRNERTAIARIEEERDSRGIATLRACYAADGHLVTLDEPHDFWHVDGVRIVDRETQKVLWEA